jgi:hypothetical protein
MLLAFSTISKFDHQDTLLYSRWEFPFLLPLRLLNPTSASLGTARLPLSRLSHYTLGLPVTLTLPWNDYIQFSQRHMIGHLLSIFPVFLKFGHLSELSNELAAYNTLRSLQGTHIPLVIGLFSLSLSHLLVLSAVPASPLRTFHDLIPSQKADLLAVVELIHRHGISHGDLEPRNVMLTVSGRIYLVDFGLSTVHACTGNCEELDELRTQLNLHLHPSQHPKRTTYYCSLLFPLLLVLLFAILLASSYPNVLLSQMMNMMPNPTYPT